MKIGIIGAEGFIGGRYCKVLESHGYEIIAGDIRSWPDDNLDIRDKVQVLEWFENNNPEIIILTAAIIRQDDVYNNSADGMDTNVTGVINVLEACRDHGALLMFSSTVHVYEGISGNVDEITPIDSNKPKHLYTQSKIIAEELIRSYHRLYGMEYVIYRYGVLYGEGGHSDMVVNMFTERANSGKTLYINGDGLQSRCFVNIGDLCRAVLTCVDKIRDGEPNVKNTTINICEGINYTISEIVDRIKLHVPNVKTKHVRPRVCDLTSPMISNTRAGDILDWHPENTLLNYIDTSMEMHATA
jgi:UDP-glucose 4-epimerase